MAIEPKSKEIGGDNYTVTPMTAVKGRRVFARLFKVIGPVLGKLSEGVNVGDLLGAAAAHVSEDDVDYFCEAFAPGTTVNGAELQKVFAVHFMGKYAEMVEWIAFAVEVNFGDFFSALAKKAPAPKTVPAAPAG